MWIIVQIVALVDIVEYQFDLFEDRWRLGVTEPMPKFCGFEK